MDHLNATHKEFLIQNNFLSYLEEKKNEFHPKFDMDAALIVEGDFPNKPNESKIVESMGSFLQRAQLKNQHLAGFLKNTLKEDKKKEDIEKKIEDFEAGKKIGLSEKIIQMVKQYFILIYLLINF
jgi:hypothetical protein